MQIAVVLLSGASLIGAAALAVGDYSQYPSESAPALRLSSAYLTDDRLDIGAFRLSMEQTGYSGAGKVLPPALQRDPADSGLWADYGEFLRASGDRTHAEYCYRRAAVLAPEDPGTLFAVGDYYTNERNAKRAVPYLSRVLSLSRDEADDTVVGNIFVYYDSLHVLQDKMADEAIPNARTARLWLIHFTKGSDPAAAREVWAWLHRKGYDDDATTARWVRYLLEKNLFVAAGEDWAAHFKSRGDGFPSRNRVFNGGFEYEAIPSEMDWSDYGFDKVKITRDDSVHHDGRYSLQVDFMGNDNPDYFHFCQDLYLTPGRYHLTGYLRTAGITSAEGVRLRVTGFRSAGVIAETQALTGTNDWTEVSANFEVGASTPIVRVGLARKRALRIDNQLTGRAWIDSVSITPLP